jgi:cell division protein FtsB
MSDRLHAAEMPRLDAFDEEFEQDPAAVLRGRRRRIMRRLWSLAAILIGAGAIAGLVLAWPNADGRLRLELQSAATSPPSAARQASQDEIDRLRREVDALGNEISELRQAQQQAAETIAALRAAAQEARKEAPPPVYWYSNPQALNFDSSSRPEPGTVPSPPRRPATARRESRGVRPGDKPASLSSQRPQ